MRWMTAAMMGAAMAAGTMAMGQQSPSSTVAAAVLPNKPAQLDSAAMLRERGRALLAKAAKSADGSASEVLNRYNGYYTLLVARVRSGTMEQHAEYDDFFFVLDGELTEYVGGQVGASHEIAPGELRGDMTGGTAYRVAPGETMHISAGLPHRTTVPAGKTVVYYVIKESVKR